MNIDLALICLILVRVLIDLFAIPKTDVYKLQSVELQCHVLEWRP